MFKIIFIILFYNFYILNSKNTQIYININGIMDLKTNESTSQMQSVVYNDKNENKKKEPYEISALSSVFSHYKVFFFVLTAGYACLYIVFNKKNIKDYINIIKSKYTSNIFSFLLYFFNKVN